MPRISNPKSTPARSVRSRESTLSYDAYGPPSTGRSRATTREDSDPGTLNFPHYGPIYSAVQRTPRPSPKARPQRKKSGGDKHTQPLFIPPDFDEPNSDPRHVSFVLTGSPEPETPPAVAPARLRAPGPPPEGRASPLPESGDPGDNQEWIAFLAADRDGSKSIDADELQSALINIPHDRPFDPVTVKMLIDIFDLDRNGVITFHEFRGILKYVKVYSEWRQLFKAFDKDNSGTIDAKELKRALRSFNYKLPRHLIKLIHDKYTNRIVERAITTGKPEGISFDSFLRACVSVEKITKIFHQYDTNCDGKIKFNLDRFMIAVLTADEI